MTTLPEFYDLEISEEIGGERLPTESKETWQVSRIKCNTITIKVSVHMCATLNN